MKAKRSVMACLDSFSSYQSWPYIVLTVCLVVIAACTSTPTPVIEPSRALNVCPQVVHMSDANSAADIFFTDKGNSPSQNSTKYNGAVQVNGPENLKAMAIASGYNASPETKTAFNCLLEVTFDPSPFTYDCPKSVTMKTVGTPAASIFYTTGGGVLNDQSTPYTGPVAIPAAGMTLRAVGVLYPNTPDLIIGSENSGVFKCTAPPPPPGYDLVTIVLRTGHDDLRQDSQMTAGLTSSTQRTYDDVCLKPSASNPYSSGSCANGSPYDQANFPCKNGALVGFASWDNYTQCSVSNVALAKPMPSAADFGTITLTLTEHNPGCSIDCDNWDLQAITVTATNSKGLVPPVTLLNIRHADTDHCIARLVSRTQQNGVTFKLDGSNSPGLLADGSPGDLYCTHSN